MSILDKIFGSYSKREIKRIMPTVNKVLKLESKYEKMSEGDLKKQTDVLKERLRKKETVNDILPDAFAVCREASKRVLNMKHFKVQVIGGIILSQGRIAEMRTGEGKTLVATLPAYLHGLTGKGVHIVTVNDYLAKRDAEWMGKVYRYLGLSVGMILNGMQSDERRNSYACDITYATNNEIGFDYLRDNMCIHKEQKVQRDFNFALVDEVDSILIDEARTPLIISGPGDKSTELYNYTDALVKTFKMFKTKELDDKEEHDDVDADYIVDEKAKTVTLTPKGVKKAEEYFNLQNLMDGENITILHHINQAIKAHGIMKKDIDYVVKDNEVLIVDEFTGRIMNGRRYSEGLHQAIEAKENVDVASESKTLATITFQNLFRIYKKLSGMTGTAMTEEGEFREIYKLDIIEIPTNNTPIRKDHPDVVYKTEKAKFDAIIDQVIKCHKKGQPVLVGTVSIEKSELLSHMLTMKNIPHSVLNAKYHELEAKIVAQAAKKGAVTIATNMAGRGTDIVLGGNAEYMAIDEMRKMGYSEDLINEANSYGETDDEEILNARDVFKNLYNKHKEITNKEAEEVRKTGGLFIIGTERHESRRIDNQLRGRAGRQGDPGESMFYLALEDDLMRLFGGERIEKLMNFLKTPDDMPIQNKLLTKSISNAQAKIEAMHFGTRKNVLRFDDIMNSQREIIYDQRSKVLNGQNMKNYIINMIKDSIKNVVNRYLPDVNEKKYWNLKGLKNYYIKYLLDETDLNYDNNTLFNITKEDIVKFITDKALNIYNDKEKTIGEDNLRELERMIILKVVDTKWTDHIDNMDELRKGIYLRSYAQKDPVIEYRIEGFEMFDEMIESIKEDVTHLVLVSHVRATNKFEKEEMKKIPKYVKYKADEEDKPVQVLPTNAEEDYDDYDYDDEIDKEKLMEFLQLNNDEHFEDEHFENEEIEENKPVQISQINSSENIDEDKETNEDENNPIKILQTDHNEDEKINEDYDDDLDENKHIQILQTDRYENYDEDEKTDIDEDEKTDTDEDEKTNSYENDENDENKSEDED